MVVRLYGVRSYRDTIELAQVAGQSGAAARSPIRSEIVIEIEYETFH
jgi:hypothetical protein